MTQNLIQVTVKLFATFRDGRKSIQEMSLAEGVTPKEIAALLEIPLEEIAIVMINGRRVPLDTLLKAEDTVAFFPPIGGG